MGTLIVVARKKRGRQVKADGAPPFELEQLRQLLELGQITAEEFKRLRSRLTK